jgi:hypothetical protein
MFSKKLIFLLPFATCIHVSKKSGRVRASNTGAALTTNHLLTKGDPWLPSILAKRPRSITPSTCSISRLPASLDIAGPCTTAGLKPKFNRLYQAYTQELQAEINDEVLETVSSIEAADMFRFGKVRDARDKELRDPDEVFIHAEERRKELAKQRKKR